MKELVEKSLKILEQGVNVATAKGAFANAKDVASLVNALDILGSFVQQSFATTNPQSAVEEAVDAKPSKTSATKKA